jgi:hypothetical protein
MFVPERRRTGVAPRRRDVCWWSEHEQQVNIFDFSGLSFFLCRNLSSFLWRKMQQTVSAAAAPSGTTRVVWAADAAIGESGPRFAPSARNDTDPEHLSRLVCRKKSLPPNLIGLGFPPRIGSG